MTAKEYLSRPDALQREIERKTRRVSFLRRQATRLSSALQEVRVRSSPDPGRMQALLDEAADEERDIPLLEEARKRAIVNAALVISRLPEEQQVLLMELRYLEKHDWDEIVLMLNLSKSRVYYKHHEALAWLDDLPEIRGAGCRPEE